MNHPNGKKGSAAIADNPPVEYKKGNQDGCDNTQLLRAETRILLRAIPTLSTTGQSHSCPILIRQRLGLLLHRVRMPSLRVPRQTRESYRDEFLVGWSRTKSRPTEDETPQC